MGISNQPSCQTLQYDYHIGVSKLHIDIEDVSLVTLNHGTCRLQIKLDCKILMVGSHYACILYANLSVFVLLEETTVMICKERISEELKKNLK